VTAEIEVAAVLLEVVGFVAVKKVRTLAVVITRVYWMQRMLIMRKVVLGLLDETLKYWWLVVLHCLWYRRKMALKVVEEGAPALIEVLKGEIVSVFV
jgi:hypothetical protein